MQHSLVPSNEVEVGPSAKFWRRLPLIARYGVAAGLTQVIYLGVLVTALVADLHYMAAILLAQVAAITYAFPVYRRQVFDVRGGSLLRQIGAFVTVWWLGAAMSLLGVPLLVEVFGLPPLVAQVLILVAGVGASFLAHRDITFRSSEHARRPSAAVRSGVIQ